MIRKAVEEDVKRVACIYDEILSEEENGNLTIGWERGVYPTEETALNAFRNGELFVLDEDGIVGAAIINKKQVDSYSLAHWSVDAPDYEVMVLHTLVISPKASGRGKGKEFVDFYEKYALENNCRYLRMDTNERNSRARKLYSKLGYKEIGIVPTTFNGIEGVGLVLLEKILN